MDYLKLREEPLKSAVREDYFGSYKYTQIGNIDFVIAKRESEKGQRFLEGVESYEVKSILWAEAKQGTSRDIYESFVQLILTIGKEKTFEKCLPPKYIGAFDAEKFAFIEYHKIQEVFYQNDFNWNVTPSNHESKEFKQLHELCENLLSENSILFKYKSQSEELKEFIKLNFKTDKDIFEKISVTKNNFTFVFQKWSDAVKPTIEVEWEKAKKAGIISADFFLADLLSSENESLKDSLYVVLKKTKYELAKKIDELGFETFKSVGFNDKQKAHKEFWAIYERPPKEEYWDYIIERRDLLVPQDIRERKGSFFTPRIWVEKSQAYLADVLGETWQDDYYIWDCCAGTGNLLNGLTNYRKVWASTLDKQDVDVMKDRIHNGWPMFENHVFQFDFLNDSFDKCPEELRAILNDENERKKLVIYINPPYAEAGNEKTATGTGENKRGVSKENFIYEKYKSLIGKAQNEIYALFLIRIYIELQNCIIAEFSKLKHLNAPNFEVFRSVFLPKLERLFVVPGNTFDNVNGDFPVGFFIWNTCKKESFSEISSDVYFNEGTFGNQKKFYLPEKHKLLSDWIRQFYDNKGENPIGYLTLRSSALQNSDYVTITTEATKSNIEKHMVATITIKNLIEICLYIAVRMCIVHTWLNDRDQFLFPNDGWQSDREFQADCLAFTLFHGQNRISCAQGVNSWIPFTEDQVGSKKAFKSNFMSSFIADFLAGKVCVSSGDLFDGGVTSLRSVLRKDSIYLRSNERGQCGGLGAEPPGEGVAEDAASGCSEGEASPAKFSPQAQAVYDAGLELWKYYHEQKNANPDAAFYDIRKYFQGEKNGRMNNASDDERYTELIDDLRAKQKALAKKIEANVYKYGFLK